MNPEQLLAERRARLGTLVQRRLTAPAQGDVSAERRQYLLEEAVELYWDELNWEKLTSDEDVTRGGLVEMTFPGFLALIEGLLLREVMPDSQKPASPRPEVVEDILHFLAERAVELEGQSDPEERFDREMTLRLIDLVLYRLHDIPVEDVERAELPADDEYDD
jgi:hypothetical protein